MSRSPLPATASRGAAAFLCLFLAAAGLYPQRIVSLAPGLTEIVFAIGRGGNLVGVTKFCDFPEAARNIKKIGGFLDVSIEALVALAPDIVIAYPEHAGKMRSLPPRVRLVTVRHDRLADLLRSIGEIGRALNSERESERLRVAIRSKLRQVAQRVQGRRKVRTLCIAGRNADELKNMFIIGRNDFLNDLLEIAGGMNAYRGAVAYPNISLESVIALDPEFILEISSHYEGISDERIFALWRPLGMVTAVVEKKVRIIKDPAWLRPGPRVGLVAEEMAGLLHGPVRLP
ncbi:MAG: helical backbone metal receptor [Acidobacteria bacterium]|nr:helical backbone metal receptor [Acidobacteriota bacterium]